MKKVSVVIPMYYEEQVAQECYNRLKTVLNNINEILYFLNNVERNAYLSRLKSDIFDILDEYKIENAGKYMPAKIEGKFYTHPLMYNLYGLNFNKDAIKKNHLAILAEGEKSSLIADGWYGDNNCVVATCGDKFNKFLIKELIGLGVTDIVVAYDRMNHDKLSEKVYFKKLYDMCKKYQCYANFSFIYDRDYILDYKAAPFDSGREVFEKLFDRRIMVK